MSWNRTQSDWHVCPDPQWQRTTDEDGYDVMDRAADRGWTALPSWGADEWDLGDWPLVILFWRVTRDGHELAEYVEGDVTQWSPPSLEALIHLTARLAYAYWYLRDDEPPWVQDYASFDELPEQYKQPPRCLFRLLPVG